MNLRPRSPGFWLLAIPVSALLLNGLLIPGYTGDDAFIHFTYIRNILERGVVAYNGPFPTYGSTSILWVLIGAAVSSVTGAIPITMRILGGAFSILACWIAVRAWTERFSLTPAEQILAAALFSLQAVAFRWMCTGMETGLVQFTLAVFLVACRPNRPFRVALLCLGAYLVRPELILLPVCHGVSVLVAGRRVTREVVLFFAGCFLLFAAWFALAWWYFGSPLPLTSIKSGGTLDGPSTLRILTVFLGTYPDLLVVTGIAGYVLLKRPSRTMSPDPLLVMWGILPIFLGGFYLFTGTNLISRYLLILHIPLLTLALHVLVRAGVRRWLIVAAPAMIVAQMVMFAWIHYSHIREFVDGFQQTYAAMGRRIERMSAADSGGVQVADVGMIGYYSRRPVIDQSGLTSTHVYDAGTDQDTALVRLYTPRFVILRGETLNAAAAAERLGHASALARSVTLVMEDRIPSLSVMDRNHRFWRVMLFELTYERKEPVALIPRRGIAPGSGRTISRSGL